jgi:hypothetical protein
MKMISKISLIMQVKMLVLRKILKKIKKQIFQENKNLPIKKSIKIQTQMPL